MSLLMMLTTPDFQLHSLKMSTLASHQTELLLQKALWAPRKLVPSSPVAEPRVKASTQKLHSLLARYHPPVTPALIQETIEALKYDGSGIITEGMDEDEMALRRAAVGAVAASLYGQILDMMLQQATEADAEADW